MDKWNDKKVKQMNELILVEKLFHECMNWLKKKVKSFFCDMNKLNIEKKELKNISWIYEFITKKHELIFKWIYQ